MPYNSLPTAALFRNTNSEREVSEEDECCEIFRQRNKLFLEFE